MGCKNSKSLKISNIDYYNEFILQLEQFSEDKLIDQLINQLKNKNVKYNLLVELIQYYNLDTNVIYKGYNKCPKNGDDHFNVVAKHKNITLWQIKSGNSEEHYHPYPSLIIFPKYQTLRFDIIDNDNFLDVKLEIKKINDCNNYSLWILGPDKPHAIKEIKEFNKGYFYRLELGSYL